MTIEPTTPKGSLPIYPVLGEEEWAVFDNMISACTSDDEVQTVATVWERMRMATKPASNYAIPT